ncbi:MAG: hypothetical protein M3253_02695 [Chloroflexota bacterium]|nr:hypothetical protein [Chloroflexota bacterium]
MAQSKDKPVPGRRERHLGGRSYRSRGVDVEIRESPERVHLKLDGHPIDVEFIDGEYYSNTAGMFTSFNSVEEIVDTLLDNEGRTWTLHGHVCDERCGTGGHHHGAGERHEHGHDHHRAGGHHT